MSNINAHYISVTAIIVKDGKFLITRRNLHEKNFPGRWTVPGGKLSTEDYSNLKKNEDGLWYEVLENTVRREVKEETGLDIDNIRYLTNMTFIRADGIPTLVLSFFCDSKSGEVRLSNELIDHAWINLEEARKYDLIDGIVEELKMVNNVLNLR